MNLAILFKSVTTTQNNTAIPYRLEFDWALIVFNFFKS